MASFFRLFFSWVQVFYFVLTVAAFTFLFYSDQGYWAPVIGVGVAIIRLFIRMPRVVYRKLLAALKPDGQYITTTASQFPTHDAEYYESHSRELLALGFVGQGEFTCPNIQPELSRLFLHPETQCLAQIQQSFAPKTEPSPAQLLLWSYWDAPAVLAAFPNTNTQSAPIASPDFLAEPTQPGKAPKAKDHGYSLTTSGEPGDWLTNIYLHNRGLVFRQPGAPLQQLLQAHLDRRREVSEKLNLNFEPGNLLEIHFAFQRRARRAAFDRLKKQIPLWLFVGAAVKGHRDEYWGRLSKAK